MHAQVFSWWGEEELLQNKTRQPQPLDRSCLFAVSRVWEVLCIPERWPAIFWSSSQPPSARANPALGDPSPKMNLLWVGVQLMPGPPGQRWAVQLLTVNRRVPLQLQQPLQQRSRGFPGHSPHAPRSYPCRYEHPLKSTAPPHLPHSLLLLHLQSKASLGDNCRQLWEAKVTGVPCAPLLGEPKSAEWSSGPGVMAWWMTCHIKAGSFFAWEEQRGSWAFFSSEIIPLPDCHF